MTYTICYRFSGAVSVEANSASEADDKFEEMSLKYLQSNCDDLEQTAILTEDGTEVSPYDS